MRALSITRLDRYVFRQLLGALLIMVGVQLVSLGLVADLLARTYHEAQGKRAYHVRTRIEGAGRTAEKA